MRLGSFALVHGGISAEVAIDRVFAEDLTFALQRIMREGDDRLE